MDLGSTKYLLNHPLVMIMIPVREMSNHALVWWEMEDCLRFEIICGSISLVWWSLVEPALFYHLISSWEPFKARYAIRH